MLKKFFAALATVLLALGISLVAVAAPASATHPKVTGTAVCNPVTGQYDITWKVRGDTGYPSAIATIKTQTTESNVAVSTTPSLIGLTVQGAGFVEGVQANVTPGQEYSLKVKVQFSTHSVGDLVDNTGKVTVPSTPCYPEGDDNVDCTSATVYLGKALTSANYINMTIRQNGIESQTTAEVDDWQVGTGIPNTESGLVLKIKKLDGTLIYLPISNEQKNSGILKFDYSQYITGPYTVTWAQFDGHDWHFGADGETLTCGVSATADAKVTKTPPTCEQGETLVLTDVTNATFGTPVYDGTSYEVTATANEGYTFPDGEKTKIFEGTLAGPNTGGVCDDEPVAITITYVPDCAVDTTNNWRIFNPSDETIVVSYNGGTHQATPGDSFLTTARSMDVFTITWGADASGVKPGTTTGTPGADLTVEDEECYTNTDVIKVVGECVYFEDGTAGNRTVTLTYDNTESSVPVLFTFDGFDGMYNRTVPAGESLEVEVPNVAPGGTTYTVTAAGETHSIVIEPCPVYEEPEPKVEERVVASFDCGDTVVTEVTTTYTAEPIFNTETLEWGYGEWVAGDSVTTTRAPTAEEISEEACVITVTDPKASTCDLSLETELTSWIQVALDPNVEYTIDGVVVTTEFTQVAPGEHVVIATGLNGYTLESANPEPDYWTGDSHTWTFTAVDSSEECVPTFADVLPEYSYEPLTCEAAGSYTIGADFGDVSWTVNGTEVPQGTYPVTAATEITLYAYPTDPEDTLNEEWTDEEIVLTFAEPDGGCATPAALALTGAATSAGVVWAGLLVVLTGLGLVFLRRKTSVQ